MYYDNYYFEIPERIQHGLATGVLKRFGAVIRDSTTGQIVCHLREIGVFEQLNEVNDRLSDIGKSVTGVQNLQMLTIGGLAGVGIIAIAGFIYLGRKLNKIQVQLDQISKTLGTIKDLVSTVHLENVISLSKRYYRAVEAYKEGDYEFGERYARDCSADILGYIINMPRETLLNDEQTLSFLMNILSATMQCQLACAYNINSDKIPIILKRYADILQEIQTLLRTYKSSVLKALPSSATIDIIKKYKNKDSYLFCLEKTLPEAIELIQNESRFIELCPSVELEKLESARAEGKKMLVVMEPV